MPETQSQETAPENPLSKGGTVVTEAPEKEAEDKAPEKPAKPEGGLDEFYNAENGEYNWQAHAQKLMSDAAKGAEEEKPEDEEKAEEKPAAPAHGTIAYEDFEKHLIEKGDISPAHREILNKVGFDNETLDGFVQVLHHSARAYHNEIVQEFGGQEVFAQALRELEERGTPEERALVDQMLYDPKTMKAGVAMVKASMRQQPLRGKTASSENLEDKPFATADEMYAAQRDPRYRRDDAEGAAYRQSVERRAAKSTFQVNHRLHTGR